jgi:hypothetical protein
MTIQLTGVLTDPTGAPLNQATIRITTLGNHPSVISGSFFKKKLGIDGAYDFPLQEGKFKVEINQYKKYNQVAWVEVTGETNTPLTLDALINDYAYCEDEAPTCPV